MHQRRVVVTGMGAITPLGLTVERLYKAACEGRSGVAPIRHFDASTFPTNFAAEVRDFDLSQHVPNADRFVNCGLNTRFALAAARQALEACGRARRPRTLTALDSASTSARAKVSTISQI